MEKQLVKRSAKTGFEIALSFSVGSERAILEGVSWARKVLGRSSIADRNTKVPSKRGNVHLLCSQQHCREQQCVQEEDTSSSHIHLLNLFLRLTELNV